MQMTRPRVRLILLIGAGIALMVLLWVVRGRTVSFIIGFLNLAYLLNPAVNWLEWLKDLSGDRPSRCLYRSVWVDHPRRGSPDSGRLSANLKVSAKELPEMTIKGRGTCSKPANGNIKMLHYQFLMRTLSTTSLVISGQGANRGL